MNASVVLPFRGRNLPRTPGSLRLYSWSMFARERKTWVSVPQVLSQVPWGLPVLNRPISCWWSRMPMLRTTRRNGLRSRSVVRWRKRTRFTWSGTTSSIILSRGKIRCCAKSPRICRGLNLSKWRVPANRQSQRPKWARRWIFWWRWNSWRRTRTGIITRRTKQLRWLLWMQSPWRQGICSARWGNSR